jgi:F-type H+-transporting ATPase subunit b
LAVLLVVGFCGAALAAAAGGEHGGGLPWKDFMYRILNFAILLGVLVVVLRKPIRNFFANRRASIEKTLADLEEQRREAEAKCQEYKGKLAALDNEKQKILDEYIQEGETEKEKIISNAEQQADYIRQQASFAIQQEIKTARSELKEEVAELTVSAAEDLLKKKIKAADQERLVNEFMSKVVESK